MERLVLEIFQPRIAEYRTFREVRLFSMLQNFRRVFRHFTNSSQRKSRQRVDPTASRVWANFGAFRRFNACSSLPPITAADELCTRVPWSGSSGHFIQMKRPVHRKLQFAIFTDPQSLFDDQWPAGLSVCIHLLKQTIGWHCRLESRLREQDC